jgi:eukaryotic-like serine/threonine-protein kinase
LKKSSGFWRTDWFVGALVVVGVLMLHQLGSLPSTLERRFYDDANASTSRQPSDKITVIAIDDTRVTSIGRWPWSRDIHAQMTDILAGSKSKVIANSTFLIEPQTNRGLVYIRKIKEARGVLNAAKVQPAIEQACRVIAEARLDWTGLDWMQTLNWRHASLRQAM